MRSRWGGLPVFAALFLLPAAAFPLSYDAHVTGVTGSTRNLGLGGANVAFPTGYAASFVNPAGLSGIFDTGFDFGSDSNGVDDFVVDLNDKNSKSLDVPLKYSFAGAAFVTDGGWGIGAVSQTPYQLDQTFGDSSRITKQTRPTTFTDTNEIKLRAGAYTLAFGRQFLDRRLGLGAAVNYNKVYESYNFTSLNPSSNPIHAEAVGDAITVDLGFLARPRAWLQVGGAYKMGYRVAFDASRNVNLPVGVTWFRDAKIPDRGELGVAFLPSKKFRVFLQSNYTRAMKDTFVVGSGLFASQLGPNIPLGQYDTLDGHWGAEFIPIDVVDLTVKLWAGGYLEKTGIDGGYSRYHRTAGFQLSPWFIDFGMAVDDAELYNNFSVGLGVDLLGVASRVAKKLGYQLPI